MQHIPLVQRPVSPGANLTACPRAGQEAPGIGSIEGTRIPLLLDCLHLQLKSNEYYLDYLEGNLQLIASNTNLLYFVLYESLLCLLYCKNRITLN